MSLKRDRSLHRAFQVIQVHEKEKKKVNSARTSILVWVRCDLCELGKAMEDMNSLVQNINEVHRR